MKYEFELSEIEFGLIRDYIHENYGILFPDDKRNFIKMKLYQRVRAMGFDSFSQYLQHVKYRDKGGEEARYMVSSLINNETYFFREMPQLKVFQEQLLPEIKKTKSQNGDKSLKILSAGCASGEEAYTLAILTYCTAAFFYEWETQVVGLDINSHYLDKAKEGTYHERSLRVTEDPVKRWFFLQDNGDYRIRDKVKSMASFRYGNITDPKSWQGISGMDVIFCRNVLIYFSESKLKKAIDLFHEALRPGGYLLLGHTESLSYVSHDFRTVRYPETVVYRKKEETACPSP